MIPKISFGNIIKVNAPCKSADQIILYSKAKTPSAVLLRKILYEGKQKPHAFVHPDNEEVSYIATGKDAAAYWDSYCSAWNETGYAHSQCGGDNDYIDALTGNIWNIHRGNVRKLVGNADISELDVQYDETGEIKSVNIVV